jgi:predicted RNase H-like nuclease
MAPAVGVDWAGNGWVAAVRANGEWTVEFYPTVLNLWHAHREAESILVDVPIGLRESGKRACDLAAKAALGSKHASVFLTPTREAVFAPNIETAKTRQQPADFGVQNQVWAIVPRIRELDVFLREFDAEIRDDQILEAHPELCFAGLNDGDPIEASKGTDAGRDARLAVLETVDPALVAAYEESVETLTTPTYAPVIAGSKTDDILDALVLAVTAWLDPARRERLPADPERDPVLDRPIQIVAPRPN